MNTINDDDLKKHVKDKDTWLRFVYLVMFGVIFYFSIGVTLLTAVLQFLAKLFGGAPFTGLAEFGDNLGSYQAEITRYLTFAADDKPFPFAPFPSKKI